MKSPKVSISKKGPYLVEGIRSLTESVGTSVETSEDAFALCRCGKSGSKPYCDGTHGKFKWNDEKADDRVPRHIDSYVGKKITIHDDRGICSHLGYCTDNLPSVFRMRKEPWIDPDEDTVDKIIETIKKCPSGALSYSIDGIHYDTYHKTPEVEISEDGPYHIKGSIDLEDEDHPT